MTVKVIILMMTLKHLLIMNQLIIMTTVQYKENLFS